MERQWIKHTSSDLPVTVGTKVDVKYRDGAVIEGAIAGRTTSQSDRDASKAFWIQENAPNDIVEWRFHNKGLAEAMIDKPQKEVAPQEDIKDTNPKDAVGIRKTPFSVLPMTVLSECGIGMLEGASKYGRHNWRGAGIRNSVYFDGTMRHLIAWWEGEDIDPDSGMSHITKAITSLMVLRDAQIRGMATDDRPPRSKEFFTELNKLAGEILDKHKDKSPKHWTVDDDKQGD